MKRTRKKVSAKCLCRISLGWLRIKMELDRQRMCKCNIVGFTSNRCCRGKAISITYSECRIISSTNFNTQFLFVNNIFVTLLSSKCFEHQHAHPQEGKLYSHSIWYLRSLYTSAQYTGWERTALIQCTGQTYTQSEDTRCCVNTIFPPEDGHVDARNISRIIM